MPRALQWTLAGLVIGIAVALAFARFGLHMTASSVLTGSMRPSFAPGDAVITRPTAVTSVHPGMVILATPQGSTTPYAHRVIAVKRDGGQVLVQTQGDANQGPDAWRDVYAPTARVSVVVSSVPKLGFVLETLHGRTTQRGVVPVGIAGGLLTFVMCAFILLAGTTRKRVSAE
jgi:signal peptidase